MPNNATAPGTRRARYEWLLLIIALALVGAFFAYLHLAETERVDTVERDRLHVLTNVIANDIQNNLATVNLSLEGVIADYPSGPVPHDPMDHLTLRLRALEKAIPGIRALLVLDANGLVTAASKSTLVGKNLNYRDYFKTARDKPDKTTLYISPPFQSLKQEKDLVITACRMMPGPDGNFAGLMVAVLNQAYFSASFTPVIYAPDMWGYLVHSDGLQLVNFPQKNGIDGIDLNKSGSLFDRHRRSLQIESVQTGPVYTTGEQRLMVLRTLQPTALHMDKAVVIGLSRSLDAIAQPLRHQAIVFGMIYAAIALCCCGALYWTQTRRWHITALGTELERLRLEADERLKLVLRGANLGLWTLHVPTKVSWSDENSFALLGLEPRNVEDDADFFCGRVHPDDLSAYLAATDKCIDGSVPLLNATFRIRHADGRWIWILTRGQAVERDAQGIAVKLMGTHLDIGAAKNAEQEIARGRDELQAIFENMTEGVLVFDGTRNIIRANRAARSILGLFDPTLSLNEVWSNIDVCLPNGEVLPQDDWPTRRGFRGDFVRNLELEIRRKDSGKNVFIEINVTPVYDESGAIALLIATYADVTERQITHALRESEVRFRTLIEDAPLAVAILRRGHFVYSNPRYKSLHGYLPEDDLIGLPWSTMISEKSRTALHAQESLIIEDSPIEQMFEAQGLGKDGHLVPVFKITTRVELIDGPATLIFAQDISAQKNAEAALLQARDDAEAASRSKAEFLANMSHEIRSPLNAILGLAYLLEQAPLELDAHNMVRKIRASGRMLLGIINDILDVSKIEAGHMAIERVAFRLEEVIDNVAVTMGIAVGEKNIQLIIQPPPAGISSVLGDALRLEQVLNNLTSNAIKFTTHGLVEMRVTLESRNEDSVVLRFCVRDTGIGIAPELQDDVFSAFTQADNSTTRRFGGTGLGLTICRRLVNLMGGEIGLSSTPGKGSEFWFTLPLQLVADDAFSSPNMVRIDVLIADGSEIELQAVIDIARGLGWQASGANSGEAVLSQLLERRDAKLPNVVVLDWYMPGMDGLATARAIRQCMPDDACPIVLMASTYALSNLATKPEAEIVDAILSKPVTASALYNATVEAQRKRTAAAGVLQAPRQAPVMGLEGIRVLVVDDSEINREVAQRILSEQGAIVTLAADGQHALDWLLAHSDSVDLVLMDVQMPVMDGIEATRRLRQMPQFNDLPIIALTAGVFKSQQEIARAAGMTHFVSKPFDVPSTVALIQRLKRRPASVEVQAHAAMPQDNDAPPAAALDLPTIDVEKGLRTWSDVRSYRDYLRRFAEGYANAVTTMEAALATDDRQAATALAHKLAGVAGNMALPDTHRMAMEAERVLAAGHDHTLAFARLNSALRAAIAAIERFAPPAETQGMSPTALQNTDDMPTATNQELKALLLDLMAALDTDNPEPMETILVTASKLLPQRELVELRRRIHDFDFRGAEAYTAKLAEARGITLKE